MPNLLVRNVDAGTVRMLKIRAAEHGRSAEAEHRQILREALSAAAMAPGFEEAAAALRARIAKRGRRQTPSEVLQRESRDERTKQLGG